MTRMIVDWGHTKWCRREGTSLQDFIQPPGREAFESAGVETSDIDAIWLGHFAALPMVEALDSPLPARVVRQSSTGKRAVWAVCPVNLSGGPKAKAHPIGATGASMRILCGRQVLGPAGEMEVPNASLAMAVNLGRGAVATYASVLDPVKG